jgi:hypothetical protein
MRFRVLAASLFALACLNASSGSDKKAKDAKTIRAEYAKMPCKVLSIVEPVEVTVTAYIKDGGTIGIELTDSKKTKHVFCHDRRSEEGVNTDNIFLGAFHPSQKGAKEAKARGPEEQELYAVLLRWAMRQPRSDALFDPSEELPDDRAQRWQRWEVRELLLRLEVRLAK